MAKNTYCVVLLQVCVELGKVFEPESDLCNILSGGSPEDLVAFDKLVTEQVQTGNYIVKDYIVQDYATDYHYPHA